MWSWECALVCFSARPGGPSWTASGLPGTNMGTRISAIWGPKAGSLGEGWKTLHFGKWIQCILQKQFDQPYQPLDQSWLYPCTSSCVGSEVSEGWLMPQKPVKKPLLGVWSRNGRTIRSWCLIPLGGSCARSERPRIWIGKKFAKIKPCFNQWSNILVFRFHIRQQCLSKLGVYFFLTTEKKHTHLGNPILRHIYFGFHWACVISAY